MCAQPRLRSAWASAQSDQSLRYALNGYLRIQAFFMRTAKTLIRLNRCTGWSESSQGAHAILKVLSCAGSRVLVYMDFNALTLCRLNQRRKLVFFSYFADKNFKGELIHLTEIEKFCDFLFVFFLHINPLLKMGLFSTEIICSQSLIPHS